MGKILRVDRERWKEFSEDAHRTVFGKIKPATFDRIDYALLWLDEAKDLPAAYVTVREVDHETVYWQFGGAFPWAQKSVVIPKILDELLAYQGKSSKRMTTYVENSNHPMLKLYVSRKLKIVGMRSTETCVLVEFVKEWNS